VLRKIYVYDHCDFVMFIRDIFKASVMEWCIGTWKALKCEVCYVLLMTGSAGKKSVKFCRQVDLNNREMNKKFWEELISYFPLILHESHRK
jgi:hypothetical protein